MPTSTTPTRTNSRVLTPRTILAICLSGVGLCAGSCLGSNCNSSTGPVTGPSLTSALATKYRLLSVGGKFLPAVYADSANYAFRVWSDTLFLAPDSTSTESGRISREDTVSLTETIFTYRSGPATWGRAASCAGSASCSQLHFSQFLGGSNVTVTVQPSYNYAILTFTTGAGVAWQFNYLP